VATDVQCIFWWLFYYKITILYYLTLFVHMIHITYLAMAFHTHTHYIISFFHFLFFSLHHWHRTRRTSQHHSKFHTLTMAVEAQSRGGQRWSLTGMTALVTACGSCSIFWSVLYLHHFAHFPFHFMIFKLILETFLLILLLCCWSLSFTTGKFTLILIIEFFNFFIWGNYPKVELSIKCHVCFGMCIRVNERRFILAKTMWFFLIEENMAVITAYILICYIVQYIGNKLSWNGDGIFERIMFLLIWVFFLG
jgi:hypothetical protein